MIIDLETAIKTILLCTVVSLEASHYHYAAPTYPFATRFERAGLFSIHGSVLHSSTKKAKNSSGENVDLFQMHGSDQLHLLGKNNQNNNLTDAQKTLLDNLWHVVAPAGYATLTRTGSITYTGGTLNTALNLTDQFFIGAEIPFYKIAIKQLSVVDSTPENLKDADWLAVYNNLNAICTNSGINLTDIYETGAGDAQIYCGWTRSADDLDNLDFLDATIKCGFLAGNAKAKDENKAFAIPMGYDKHKGAFISFDTAFGFGNYFSFGFHINQLFLFKKNKLMRLSTAEGQSGFIKLSSYKTERAMGNLYEVGGFARGELSVFSLSLGYIYGHKGDDLLTTDNSTLFPSDIINSDPFTKGWSMHTLHLGLDIDLTKEDNSFHPQFSVFYNHIVQGKRVFLNHTYGGQVGCMLTMDF